MPTTASASTASGGDEDDAVAATSTICEYPAAWRVRGLIRLIVGGVSEVIGVLPWFLGVACRSGFDYPTIAGARLS